VANRDPAVWDRPDDFVLDRFEKPDAPRLLTFGTGAHYCLGANLARMTLEEAVRGLVENPAIPPSISPISDGEWSSGEVPSPCPSDCTEYGVRPTGGRQGAQEGYLAAGSQEDIPMAHRRAFAVVATLVRGPITIPRPGGATLVASGVFFGKGRGCGASRFSGSCVHKCASAQGTISFQTDGMYRAPSGACPYGGDLPEEMGTVVPGKRGRVLLRPMNLDAMKVALRGRR